MPPVTLISLVLKFESQLLLFLIHLPAIAPGKASEDGPSVCAPAVQWGDLTRVPSVQLSPGSCSYLRSELAGKIFPCLCNSFKSFKKKTCCHIFGQKLLHNFMFFF